MLPPSRDHPYRLSRRALLDLTITTGLGVLGTGLSFGQSQAIGERGRRPMDRIASQARAGLKEPGSLPHPHLPAGTVTLPQIEHIVVVMMENHSFDNLLGTLGRGDGLPKRRGRPVSTNDDRSGDRVRSFHMPTPCQVPGHPSQTWNNSHIQWDRGRNDGFVRSASGPVAMGYWTSKDMPFTNGLATTFPLADRWFASTLCQTIPNRRFLMAGTSLGQVDDTPNFDRPPNGTIFEQLNAHGVGWRNYSSSLPSVLVWSYLAEDPDVVKNLVPIEAFYRDAAAGDLPGFAIVDPDFGRSSEEDPQDIQYGDQFLASVVHAVMSGPGWPRTVLVWCYDEHGGYYDHVAPPAALPPDEVAPKITVPPDEPGAFDRFGFRVPAGIVSPYSRPRHVSHTVYDHTSVLKLVATKWNLPSLTRRDANANNLLDMLDLRHATFIRPPRLPAAAEPGVRSSCLRTGPGPIPSG